MQNPRQLVQRHLMTRSSRQFSRLSTPGSIFIKILGLISLESSESQLKGVYSEGGTAVLHLHLFVSSESDSYTRSMRLTILDSDDNTRTDLEQWLSSNLKFNSLDHGDMENLFYIALRALSYIFCNISVDQFIAHYFQLFPTSMSLLGHYFQRVVIIMTGRGSQNKQ